MLLIIRLKLFKSIVLKVQIKFIQAKSKLSSMLSVLSFYLMYQWLLQKLLVIVQERC